MTVVKNGTLQVPGASLYYEIRGKGPVLLMIHGGGGDADKFLNVANHLADWYTVVTYDRRGHSRSHPTDQTEDYRVETHSDDAHRLLAKLTDEPAYVFGSSSGAVIGLDLCVRHPEQVKLLIPHEPVLLQLLFGDEQVQARKFMENLMKNHQNEVIKLLSNIGAGTNDQKQPKDVQTERMLSNSTYFVEYEIPGTLNYSLDIDALQTALKSSPMQVLPAGGSDSRDFFAYRCAVALSEQLGTEIVEFPGHHGGYNTSHHKEFAEKLHEICSSRL
ncbi:hydrolase [Bacillus pseudomycoides]|uniref:alpha/beta fold hydrolase n=1 Tax=Bacillus TaxID=1386 RepID=UPI00036BF8EC|nr:MULTISPECIES: alpha/beta hydrolase [Bacillus]MBD5797501.1 hydrolase [Bacillus pseudomycoides]MED1475080.1 alpha/beta hydrolase [Bacillus pseudomycoides]PDZ08823.1 alpha/beta hydrolase [Bacillus pseudomycoides]PEO88658.1 alpha/beta hydrolase [Bacillus pseudomycoides]PGS05479.1 alpha/beta hydrolase [Bacillus pseudomycoides]